MLTLRGITPSPSHEDVFIQRYQWLMGFALQLTERQRGSAEDLVHDAFIQFTLHRPDLQKIENIEGYLYRMLRNMHLSQVRRLSHTKSVSLSVVDYDSAEIGLRVSDHSAQLQVRDDLRRICHYACVRGETSQIGSILILRFFHGYYPGEIALILGRDRRAVDDSLRIARREAKLYLEQPARLKFMIDKPIPQPTNSASKVSNDFLSDLREQIFQAPRGACFERRELQRMYGDAAEATVDTNGLTHLVSCRRCLDEVNRVLNLPPLSERFAMDTIGRDSSGDDSDRGDESGPPDASGGAGAEDFKRRSKRRFRDVIEHRPQELMISVNGFILGSQKIGAEINEQTINVNMHEQIRFVEVFSEQWLRLSFLEVEHPTDGEVEQRDEVEFNDGRSLGMSLRFGSPWPTLHVRYHDPALTAQGSSATIAEDTVAEARGSNATVREADRVRTARGSGWLTTLHRGWPSVRRRRTFDLALFLRPATVTAVFAALLIAVFLFVQLYRPARLSVADLLQRATVAEESSAAAPDQVLHRTLQLEERKFPSGELIARSRIELWQTRDATARRLYDSQNRLIAGEWTKDDDSRILYQHGSKLIFQSSKDVNKQNRLASSEIWKLAPSAKEFSSLRVQPESARIEEESTGYVVSYAASASERSSEGLVKATVRLNRADLHATELTIVVGTAEDANPQSAINRGPQPGSPDGVVNNPQSTEFRFTEIAYERRALQTVPPAVFEPDLELLTSPKLETRNSKPETETSAPLPLAPTATAALEVEVLRLLGQVSADMGQEVSVKREADGALHVEAIVESEKRKAEILSALVPMTRERAVKVRIETTTEAQARIRRERRRAEAGNSSSDETLEGATTENTIPVDAEIRQFLGSQGLSGRQVSEEVTRLSNRMLNRSHQALLHAFAMKNLVQRFSSDDLRSLDAQARTKWLAMIAAHANAFQRDMVSIRQELAPIFGAGPGSGDAEMEVTDDASLFRATTRLSELASATNESIQSAFTISSTNKSVAIRTPQFWRSVDSARRLANKIGAVARP